MVKGHAGTPMTIQHLKRPKKAFKAKANLFCVKCRQYTRKGQWVVWTPQRLIKHVRCPKHDV